MDVLQDEVESLTAILMEDVRITTNEQSGFPEIIETTVLPHLDEESEQQQCVCVTLQVLPRQGYPDISPEFKLVRPRGLDDACLDAIRTACTEKLQRSVGFPVVFDLIEAVRERLTDSSVPSGRCVICLYGFSDGDEITRTNCFHYLHSYCLGRHLTALRRNFQEEHDKLPAWLQKTNGPFQAACPVCREPIKDEADSLKCAMPPSELENAPEFMVTAELRELQDRMSRLFLQQKRRGGIIDTEANSAAVIALETQQELRRRLPRKTFLPLPDEGIVPDADCPMNLSNTSVDFGNMPTPTGSGPTTMDAAAARPSSSRQVNSTNIASSGNNTNSFAPVVQPHHMQRLPILQPTNNNYQPHHNRRHYRGGRRHQQQQHHQRDRERERERHEHNHLGAGHGAGGAVATAGNAAPAAMAPPTSNNVAADGNGRQPKDSATNGATSR